MGPKVAEESREILEKGQVHSEVVGLCRSEGGFAVRGDLGSEREVWSKRGSAGSGGKVAWKQEV
jgi:hypothetical protein